MGVVGWSVLLLIVPLLSGCVNQEYPESNGSTVDDENPFRFTWSPSPGATETVIMVNVTTGPQTECRIHNQYQGRGGSETALVSTFFGHGPNATGTAWTTRQESTVHTGPLNTDVVHAETWGGLIGFSGHQNWTVKNDTYYEGIYAHFDLQEPDEGKPYITIECNSDNVYILFYEADAYQPIIDRSATGGAGVYKAPYAGTSPSLTVNQKDHFTIETTGKEVRFFAQLGESEDSFVEPYISGKLHMDSPSSQEEVPLEEVQNKFVFSRSWQEPGEFILELDQVSINNQSFMGLLAGFNLTEELGNPDLTLSDRNSPD